MQFKYPEFLLALFLLLIPILIHLFKLRKFKTEYFTNVKLLRQIAKESRKRSQLKKWLVLALRMLGLAALVLAFAQPFRPHSKENTTPEETVIYIDNSLSMQQKGDRGALLYQAVQDLVQHIPEDKSVSVMTNDQVFRGETFGEIKQDLLDIDYSSGDDDFKTVFLRAQNIPIENRGKQKRLIAISDFQAKNFDDNFELDTTYSYDFIQLKNNNAINFSIDSVAIKDKDAEIVRLTAYFSANQSTSENLTVDLYNGASLYAKNNAKFEDGNSAEVEFSIPIADEILEGEIRIDDHQLAFDNHFYFSLQPAKSIRVLSLYSNHADQVFLNKLFREPTFSLGQQPIEEVDYGTFETADFIVLNEMETIPTGLGSALSKFANKGGHMAIIPSLNAALMSYNQLMSQIGLPPLSAYRKEELKISTINFSHPLYKGVFKKTVDNFQYPKVEGYYKYNSGEPILEYNNGAPFLLKQGRIYLFTSPLDQAVTNFKQSPLIVPTFYNMAMQSLNLPKLSYTLFTPQKIDIKTDYKGEKVVHLRHIETGEEVIPPQRKFHSKIELDVSQYPDKSGLYDIVLDDNRVGHLAFNDSRAESELTFMEFEDNDRLNLASDLKQFLKTDEYKRESDSLWKWFLTFAILFFVSEFLILKFFKK